MIGGGDSVAYLTEIKEKMIVNPESIASLLEVFEFSHIHLRHNEIRFARDEIAGQNIRIKLQGNDFINVMDYPRGVYTDIFSYIIQEKNATFRDVLQETKKILGLDNYWRPQQRRRLFNGIYDHIGRNDVQELKIYDESILADYQPCGNLLWLMDNITLEAQRFYDVHFDVAENSIIFPWRSPHGDIIAVKSRYNGETPEGMSKYWYPVGGNISASLFNYSSCYEHLYGNDLYIFESEKSCMIAWGRGIKNTLAIGSNSLSPTQCKLILQLQPNTIYLMLDSDLDLTETKKNADLIKKYAPMRMTSIKFWDWRDSLEVGAKSSPMDGTIDNWNYILANEMKDIKELDKELTYDEI